MTQQVAWEQEDARMRTFVRQIPDININDELTILDIGSWTANEGIKFTKIFPNAKVFCFEPNPISIELCNQNINNESKDISDRITLVGKAACETDGKTSFYPLDRDACASVNDGVSSLFKFLPGYNSILGGEVWIQKEIEVDSCRIDTWCEENGIDHIDLIWMDVQGAELLVLKGMPRMLKTIRGIATEAGLKPYYDGHTLKPEITHYLEQFDLIERYWCVGPGHSFEGDVVYTRKTVIDNKV